MKQRVPRRAWRSAGRPGRRPRILIEDDHPALAISDFSLFEQAGLTSPSAQDLALTWRPAPCCMTSRARY
jgi:hypothetical protein